MARLPINMRLSMLSFLRFLHLWLGPCIFQESKSAKNAVGSDGAEGLWVIGTAVSDGGAEKKEPDWIRRMKSECHGRRHARWTVMVEANERDPSGFDG
jgi:hypothetical protein